MFITFQLRLTFQNLKNFWCRHRKSYSTSGLTYSIRVMAVRPEVYFCGLCSRGMYGICDRENEPLIDNLLFEIRLQCVCFAVVVQRIFISQQRTPNFNLAFLFTSIKERFLSEFRNFKGELEIEIKK